MITRCYVWAVRSVRSHTWQPHWWQREGARAARHALGAQSSFKCLFHSRCHKTSPMRVDIKAQPVCAGFARAIDAPLAPCTPAAHIPDPDAITLHPAPIPTPIHVANHIPIPYTMPHPCHTQDVLQNTVGGGKPKMKWHFNRNGWPASKAGPPPATEEAKNKLVDDLQVCVCVWGGVL